MINSEHIQPKLIEYTLGLLSHDERTQVEQHTAVCPTCNTALQEEMALEKLVHTTLHTATNIDNGRIVKLMPALPTQSRPRFWLGLPWQKQLASLAIMLVLIFGGMSFYQTNLKQSPGFIAPTSLAVTATNTVDPTETAVATESAQHRVPNARGTAVSTEADIVAPQPAATPIAYVAERGN